MWATCSLYFRGLSDAAMDNPISSINVKVSLTMLPMVLPGLSIHHPSMATHSDHLWTIHGSKPVLVSSVYIHRVTVPSMEHPWMATLPPLPSLSKYPWMPELLCHPWTIHGWPPCLPFPLCLSIHGCQSYCAIHGASMDGHLACPSLSV